MSDRPVSAAFFAHFLSRGAAWLPAKSRGVELPKASPGDLIALFQAGAYGRTASPTAFLGPSGPRGNPRMTT